MTDAAHSHGHSTDGESNTPLQSIDASTLTPLVRKALGSETVEITDYRFQEVLRGVQGGVYRFTGSGYHQGETVQWSLILKAIRPVPGSDDPSGWAYWRREALAYQSGLLDDLPGDLAAPQCFSTVEQANEGYWLWLEEVKDELGPQWPLEHYGVVARHLGQFNGAYLTARPIPSQPWLSRGWLRQYIAGRVPGTTFAPRRTLGTTLGRDSLGHPLVRDVLPTSTAEGICHLWAERDMFLDALDHLPHTFCHLDAFRLNLFARHGVDGADETVVIDWTEAGTGAIGEEIVPLVTATIAYGEVELNKAPELERIVFEGYLDGLRDAGWRGDPRLVRFGYSAASALHYCFVSLQLLLSLAFDEDSRAQWEQASGVPARESMGRIAEQERFLLGLADEARELLDALSQQWQMGD